MSNRQKKFVVFAVLVLGVAMALPVLAQSASEMAALENRLMARLELRLAEDAEEQRSDQEATRLAFEQAVHALAVSNNALNRRALVAIDEGRTSAGLSALEEIAHARDGQARASNDAAVRQARADDWKRIGALAFLDNTARAVSAYEQALNFAPNDPVVLDQLSWLYGRQERTADRTRMAQRLADLPDPESRVRGLLHLADIHLDANDGPGARPFIDQAAPIAHDNHLLQLEAEAIAFQAAVLLFGRDWNGVDTTAQRSLAISRPGGFRNEEAMALYIQGTANFVRAQTRLTGRTRYFQAADQFFGQVEDIYAGLNDQIAVAEVKIRRGHVARLMQNYPLAEQRLREAIETLDRLGVRARVGFARGQLAATLAAEHRYGEATPMFQSAVQSAHDAGFPAYEAMAYADWARAESDQGHSAEACRLASEGARILDTAPGQEANRGPMHTMANLYCMLR